MMARSQYRPQYQGLHSTHRKCPLIAILLLFLLLKPSEAGMLVSNSGIYSECRRTLIRLALASSECALFWLYLLVPRRGWVALGSLALPLQGSNAEALPFLPVLWLVLP